ncbi:MAG: ABC transporter substrate-binding protein [Corallococcus sp.]|nr:ABC transporter substrate-binding protein [Corallococcus sp.]MCM1359576.1 ABC transporter substrate-binding protein [Corallococcus sp.]MCM1395168.1 ABC transporter substrate-binding protein [Corallococcus sp.]
MKKITKITAVVMAVLMSTVALVGLVGCNETPIDNETTRLVLAASEFDGVFNPFYSSSAPDGEVVGMTQLGMLTTDKDGNVAYGNKEACVVLDYSTETVGEGENRRTTFKFVLKNNVKFSNGSPLTMKDVLFNLYVYLDPAYTGSATIYSTDIVGLAEYRTQTSNISEQEKFERQFEALGQDRIDRLTEALGNIQDANKNKTIWSDAELKTALQTEIDDHKNYADSLTDLIADAKAKWDADPTNESLQGAYEQLLAEQNEELKYKTLIEDYELAKEYFKNELQSTWNLSKGTAEDISFLDGAKKLSTDAEAFLYNTGFITWNKKEERFDSKATGDYKNFTEKQAIDFVYDAMFTKLSGIAEVINGWETSLSLLTSFTAAEKKAYFDQIDDVDKVKNISGITFANRGVGNDVYVNGTKYSGLTSDDYNTDGSVKDGKNEVLQIVIKDVDPKAIWNFAFSVAPMYYYSNAEQIGLFDYEEHFGVDYSNEKFFTENVNSPAKNGVPVGAGPYKATTRTGESSKVNGSNFKENGVVYFERNDHFMFPAKIKYVNYKVTDTKSMLESLFSNDIHFVEPACKDENIKRLQDKAGDGYSYKSQMTNGYGYIGINAEKVPNMAVRQAIMHAINIKMCTDYYLGYAQEIYRPMTRASWAYPKETDAAGQYYAYWGDGQNGDGTNKYEQLLESAGYTKNADGIYQNKNGDDVLSGDNYTFTIAGDDVDHPAYNAMKNAADILNKHGFNITVKKDINALKKLNTGSLAIWAAAWGSGVDPDMYQVYHIDSLAGSTSNWGYRAIRRNLNGKYAEELKIVTELSQIIDDARAISNPDQDEEHRLRAAEYAKALDLIMQLAVELPTYQRSDLFAYNTKVIDVNSLTPESEITPFNGPIAKLWEVSLNETK